MSPVGGPRQNGQAPQGHLREITRGADRPLLMESSHASSDRRQADRPRHQVVRARRVAGPRDRLQRARLQAHRRAGQPGLLLAARQRRVHQGARQARGVPEPERHPDHGRLRAHRRPQRRGPRRGQGRRAGVRRHRRRHRQGDRPDPVPGRPGRADAGHVQLRQGRVEQDARRRRRAAQDRRSVGRVRPHRGPGRTGRRLGRGVRWYRRHPAGLHPARGDPDPARDLSQPGPLDPADLLRRDRAVHRAGRGLPPREVRRPDRQRAESGHPDGARDRRRHRLRAAARRALPGRAPPPRGPARGDGVRAAPRQPGDLRQWHDRGPRHAVPAARRDELDGRPRSGPRRRHPRGARGDDDAAARAAGDLRTLGVLAEASRVRLSRAHGDRLLGPGRHPGRRGVRARSGWARPRPSRSPAWASSRWTPTDSRARTPTPRSSTRSSDRRCSPRTGCPTSPPRS